MAYYPNYQNYQNMQNPYYNNYQPLQNMQQPQQNIPIAKSDSLIHVNSEQEARNYPVAPGNCVQFKDDTKPVIYIKTMSFNQFEAPLFEKYKLVKEEPEEPQEEKHEPVSYSDMFANIDDFNNLKDLVERLQADLSDLKLNNNIITVEEKKTPRKGKIGAKESDSE